MRQPRHHCSILLSTQTPAPETTMLTRLQRKFFLVYALILTPQFVFAQNSPDLSTLTVADSQAGKSLQTSVGKWTFGPNVGPGGNEILINGNGNNGGQATAIQVGDGGKMFAH